MNTDAGSPVKWGVVGRPCLIIPAKKLIAQL
jgi:hypothetical protein